LRNWLPGWCSISTEKAYHGSHRLRGTRGAIRADPRDPCVPSFAVHCATGCPAGVRFLLKKLTTDHTDFAERAERSVQIREIRVFRVSLFIGQLAARLVFDFH
jgi:hypothetical protein